MTAGYLIDGAGPRARRDRQPELGGGVAGRPGRPRAGPGDLAGVAVTHIHLDHAGGVGDVAQSISCCRCLRRSPGSTPPGGPGPPHRFGGHGARRRPRLVVRPDGADATGAGKGAGGRREDIRVSPGRDALEHRGLARARQTPPRPARQGDRSSLRGRRRRGAAARRRRAAPAAPPPDFDLAQAVHSLHRFVVRLADRPRPRPLRAAAPPRRRAGRGRGHPAPVGERGRTGVARRRGHRRRPRHRLRRRRVGGRRRAP